MINKPYVLFTRIHLIKNSSGRVFCDPLWAKDLKLHLDYINDFRICCPVIFSDDVHDLVDITECKISHLIELKKDYGLISVMRNIFPNFISVIKACKGASIVHSGGAGWAFPLSFYLLTIRPFFSFQWIIVIESSFWMLNKGDKVTLRKAISHIVHKLVLSSCLKRADSRIFTQTYYRTFFLNDDISRSLIAPATWIDKSNLISPAIVKKRHLDRKGKLLEMIFPARLIEDKGVFVLLDAIKLLIKDNVQVNITIMGSGELKDICKVFCLNMAGNVNLTYIEPVEYGQTFLDAFGSYDVVLVPNLKEEQPRIVFDAFSQGLCVIGSDTSGILDITDEGNAVICKRGDPDSLAKAICYVIENPNIMLQMGLNGLNYADGKTHHQMHLDREKFLASVLDI